MQAINTENLLLFEMLADGLEFKEIAKAMGMKHNTFKRKMCELYQATGTDNDRHLVAYAFRKGLVR